MRVVGVDIGGTFTDFMLYDTESGSVHVHKVPLDARPTRARDGRRARGAVRAGRARAVATSTGVFHGTTIATNAVLEHDGAVAGMITTARLPRRRPHRAPPAAAALLGDAGHPVAGAAARAAPPPQGRERADRAADGRGARAARRGRGARRGARAARRGRRGRRRLLPLLVPQPGARAARRGDRARGDARTRSSRRASTSSRSSASSSASRRRRMSAFVGPKTGSYLERLAAGARRARASTASCT